MRLSAPPPLQDLLMSRVFSAAWLCFHSVSTMFSICAEIPPPKTNPKRKEGGEKIHKRAVISPARFLQLLCASPCGTVERFSACLQGEQSASRLSRRDHMTRAITIKRYSGSGLLCCSNLSCCTKGLNANEAPGLETVFAKEEGSGRNVLPWCGQTFFFPV